MKYFPIKVLINNMNYIIDMCTNNVNSLSTLNNWLGRGCHAISVQIQKQLRSQYNILNIQLYILYFSTDVGAGRDFHYLPLFTIIYLY